MSYVLAFSLALNWYFIGLFTSMAMAWKGFTGNPIVWAAVWPYLLWYMRNEHK